MRRITDSPASSVDEEKVEELSFYDVHITMRQDVEREIRRLNLQLQELKIPDLAMGQKEAQREIRRLKLQLQELLIQRNSLLPISTLPIELLTRIFALCRMDKVDQFGQMGNLLRMTWVCHHWRSAALACAQLWAYIGKSNFRWLEQSVERSRQSQLAVDLSLDNQQAVWFLDDLFDHLPRIHYIRLNFTSIYSLGKPWTQPAPVLRELLLENADIPSPILFSGVAPLLHTLRLTRCTFKWTPNIIPLLNLRSITISNPLIPIPLESIFAILRSTPNLEALSLDETITPVSSNEELHILPRHGSDRAINLQKMQILEMVGVDLSQANHFFHRVVVPPLAHVRVEASTSGTEQQLLADFLVTSARTERHPIKLMMLHQSQSSSGLIIMNTSESYREPSPLNLAFLHSISWEKINLFFLNTPFNDLQALTLHSPDRIPVETWTNVVFSFTNLQQLNLRVDSVGFIDFVAAFGSSREPPHPLPELAELGFSKPPGSRIDAPPETISTFFDALVTRRNDGFGLKTFVIEGPMFAVNRFRKAVDNVVVL